MKRKAILSLMLAFLVSGLTMAQTPMMQNATRGTQNQNSKTWQKPADNKRAKQSLTPEQINEKQQKRAEEMCKKMNLTEEQTKAIIPLMKDYQVKKMERHRAMREALKTFHGKENKSTADYQKMVDVISDTKVKDANLQKEYYKNISKVLPAEKVYEMSKMEMNMHKMSKTSKHSKCTICKGEGEKCNCSEQGNKKMRMGGNNKFQRDGHSQKQKMSNKNK